MSTATITLGDELAATLERLAKERSVTVESLILELVEGAMGLTESHALQPEYARAKEGKRHIPFAGLFASDGVVTGANSEDYLRAEFSRDPDRDR